MHVLPREAGAELEGALSPRRARTSFRRGRSLRSKLVGLALLTLLPALLLGAIDSFAFLVHEREAVQRAALVTARLAAQHAWELARGTDHFLDALSEVETVKRGAPEQRDQLFAAIVSRYPRYNAIFFIGLDGQEQGLSTHQPGQARLDLSQRPEFQEALQTRSFTIGRQPVQAPWTGEPVVRMLAPVLDEQSSLLGFVGAGLKLLRLQDLWANLELPMGTAVSLVERNQGLVFARTPQGEERPGQSVAAEVVEALRAHDGGTHEYRSEDGTEWLAAFARIEDTPWAAVVAVPAEVAFADWRAALVRTAALLLLAFVLALGLARALAARLAAPARALAAGALALAAGQLQHRVVVRSGDELERVADQFNAMAAQLERERALLEERVAAATAAQARLLAAEREARADLQAVLGAVEQGVMLVGADGRVRFANPRLSELFGGNLLPAGDRPNRGQVVERMRERVAEPEPFEQRLGELYGQPRLVAHDTVEVTDPTARTLERYSAPVYTEDGQVLGRIEGYTDVTELRRLERLREEFLTVAAHELRTPLASIHALAQLLLRNVEAGKAIDPVRLRRSLSTILRQSQRLNGLVLDLLDVSRLRQDRLELRPALADLAALVRDAVEQVTPIAEAGQHRLALDVPAAPLQGAWDPARVEQVVLNLLSNALRFSPPGTEVRVTLAGEVDGALLSVADHGQGIPPNEVPRLFRPFERALDPLTRYQAGLGLGLYLARGIVQAHGGRIWAEPAEGQGTTFYVWLPLGARGVR
ncbi:MAG: HAMP domain-containing protein [Chloroflexi bacterium]|nr:HAMP domain-containing protein [Chloroflexota bacterium]